jgi:hypothetical protein
LKHNILAWVGKATILYNESKHNILALVGKANKISSSVEATTTTCNLKKVKCSINQQQCVGGDGGGGAS